MMSDINKTRESKLCRAELLSPSGAPGIYARGRIFEDILDGIGRAISSSAGNDRGEVLRFPPVIPQSVLIRNGYFLGFPHLAGCVHSFLGNADAHKRLVYKQICDEPTDEEFQSTGCALTPAACYPVYPLIAARGPVPDGGLIVDVESYCFRHEPSDDPARMQAFRMREFVIIGSAETALGFRDDWVNRAKALSGVLGLEGRIDVANDPFFGDGGSQLRLDQASRNLKFEMQMAVSATGAAACMSFNYHEAHFGSAWGLRRAGGAVAHTACVGFGMERLTLAMLSAHGGDIGLWPASVRNVLWPTE